MRYFICIAIILFTAFSVYPQDKAIGHDLSLAAVSQLALENNLDIKIAKLDAYMTRFDLDKDYSLFDTYLNMSASHSDNQTRPPSIILGSKALQDAYSFSLEKRLPSGTSIAIEGTHARDWTDSVFSSTNPAIEAKATVTLTQSLGKNFFGLIDRLGIAITKLDIESSDWLSLNDIETSLADTQKAYWQLVLAQAELAIKKNNLTDAQALYRAYQDKSDLGLIEDPDIYASGANVLLRQSEVSVAELGRTTAKNNLLFLLNEENTSVEIRPQDPLDLEPESIDLAAELTSAINNRRDYKIAKNTLEADDIDLRIKNNSLWPEIDLQASYARNGLSSRYKDSWEQITDQDNPEYFAGITVRLPIENRFARADQEQAKLNKEKGLLSLKRVERLILRELHDQVARVNTFAGQITLYRKAAELQGDKLKAEKIRFKNGRSNSDLIIRYEEDLLESQLRLVRTLYGYRASRIELEVMKNTLLDAYWKDSL
ncbi:TolC family protein [Candidatus Omnitrophota bacterium]